MKSLWVFARAWHATKSFWSGVHELELDLASVFCVPLFVWGLLPPLHNRRGPLGGEDVDACVRDKERVLKLRAPARACGRVIACIHVHVHVCTS